MNNRRRDQGSRRPGSQQVQFCQRCGGIMSSPQGGNSNNVCRCSKEERARYRGGTPTPETAEEK